MSFTPSFSKLNVLLGRVQGAIGTKEDPLINTDFRTVGDDFSLDYIQDFKEQGLAQGLFGNPARIKSTSSMDAKITIPVIPEGVLVAPNIADFLKCSGLEETEGAGAYCYAPSSVVTDWKDMTLWSYTGDKDIGYSMLTKGHSFMFDGKISFEIGGALMAEFTGKGIPDGKPAPASYVSGALALLSSIPPAFLKTTALSILGETYCILKGELTFGNQIELLKCPSADSGFLRSTIKGLSAGMTLTVYQDMASADPIAEMDGEVEGSVDIKLGATDYGVEIGSAAARIIAAKNGKDGDLNTHELQIMFTNNFWSIIFNS